MLGFFLLILSFSKKIGAKGWLGMSFPKKYGGHERTALERYIVTEELISFWSTCCGSLDCGSSEWQPNIKVWD